MTMQRSGIEIVVDTTSLNQMVGKADEADEALNRIVDTANEIDSALSGIADSIDVSVDVGADTTALDDLVTELDAIDAATYTADATAETDTQAADELVTELEDIDATSAAAEATAETDTQSVDELVAELDAIDTTRAAAEATAETDTQAADELVTELETLDQTKATAEVQAKVTDADKVEALRVNILNIAGAAAKASLAVAGIATAVGGAAVAFGVKNFLDMDAALDSIEARTGRMIPDAEHLITDIYELGWGESRDEIASVIIQMDHLNIATGDFETAAVQAFQTAQITGRDVNTVLQTMNQMVITGISPNFQAAADVIVAGFQNGADRGGDFLDVLNRNAPVIGDMGLNAETFTNILITGLNEGFTSANQVSDALVILRGRLSDNSQDVQKVLQALNLVDLTQSYLRGQTSGDTFLEGLSSALARVEDPARQLEYTNTLFGRQGRTFGLDALTNLQNIGEEMGDIQGRADQASNVLQRDFGETIQRTFRTLEDRVIAFLSSDQIDLPGKLAILESQLEEFINNVQTGKSIAASIDIAFDLNPGTFERIESAFNNIALGFLQAIQTVLEVLGKTDFAEQLGTTIAGYAKGQLTFDLKLATTADDIKAAVDTALSRGVDASVVGESIGQAINEAAQAGNFDVAMSVAESAQAAFAGTTLEGTFAGIAQDLADQFTDELNQAILAGDYAAALPFAKAVGSPEQIDAINAMITAQQALQTETDTTATNQEDAANRTTEAVDYTKQNIADYAADSGQQLDLNVQKFNDWAQSVTKNLDAVDQRVDEVAASIAGLNAASAQVGQPAPQEGAPGQTAPAPPAQHGGTFGAGERVRVGEAGPEMITMPREGSIINAASTSILMRAINSLLGRAGGPVTNIYNLNVSSLINTTNLAQADAAGSKLSKAVRGFG